MALFSESRYTNIHILSTNTHTQHLRCFDTQTGQSCLMTVFLTGDDAEKSFVLTEAAVVKKLALQGLATIFDVGVTTQEQPYIAFEEVQSIPLENIPHAQCLDMRFFLEISTSLLQALKPLHAHYRSLLCISPQSVHVAESSPDAPVSKRVRIGLERWLPPVSADILRSRYGGHNHYTAPEVLLERTVDARADMYSIGVVLYETVTAQSFAELALVDAPGMLSHLVLKSLREAAPHFPDVLVQWMYALLEQDRSMRFSSADEALDYLQMHGLWSETTITETLDNNNSQNIEPPEPRIDEVLPVAHIPVYTVGVDNVLAAIVNVQSPYTESAVLELSGERGIGKTMLLESLMHSRLQAATAVRQRIVMLEASSPNIVEDMRTAAEEQKPTLFLLDDSEELPESTRAAIKEFFSDEHVIPSGVRLIAAHRSQLPAFATKASAFTLSHFAPAHLPLFCSEMLGRCAFTPDFHKELYAVTKGHPLFLEAILRYYIEAGIITRRNRIWTNTSSNHLEIGQPLAQPLTPAHSLQGFLTARIRALNEESRSLMALLLALDMVNVHQAAIHLLAEALDDSTQAVMRFVLPLSYQGFVRVVSARISIAHDLYKEAVALAVGETVVQEFRTRIAERLGIHAPVVQKATPETPSTQAPSSQAPSPKQPSNQAPSNQLNPLEAGIFLGSSKAVEHLRRQVRLAAAHDVPCLIESGVGIAKEDIAAALHAVSSRAERPFYAVVCSDFSEGELERYVFGDEKLSDKASDKASDKTGEKSGDNNTEQHGLFAECNGGTLFFDDITAAPLAFQARLARLIQTQLRRRTKQYRTALPAHTPTPTPPRFGALHYAYDADVRICAGLTTAEHLPEQMLRLGILHQELFFVMNSVRIVVPSLSERREDIAVLAGFYGSVLAEEYGRVIDMERLPAAFVKALAKSQWTGNITELESVMRRFVLLYDSANPEASISALSAELHRRERTMAALLTPSTKPQASSTQFPSNQAPSKQPPSNQAPSTQPDHALLSIDDAQKEHILRALELTQGNKSKAAQMLNIKRTTLLARMKKFGLMP